MESVEHVFFRNLILLGFDPANEKKRHNVVFSPEMFKSPNVKAMEVVFYFIFSCLDPSSSKEYFRTCWPIVSKDQQRDFKKLLFAKLSEMEAKRLLPSNIVQMSHLHTCSGERFCHLVWHLSERALRTVLERESPSYVLPHFEDISFSQIKYYEQYERILKIQIMRQSRRFLEFAKRSLEIEKIWKQFDQSLQVQLEEARRELLLVKTELSQLEMSLKKSPFMEKELQQRATDLRESWIRL